MPNTRVKCTGCDFTGLIIRRPIELIYQFPDGSELKSSREPGWCEYCDGIRDIEHEFDVATLQEKIDVLSNEIKSQKSLFSKVSNLFGGNESSESIELRQVKLMLKLALTRKSSARCLICGNEGATSLWQGKSGPYKHSCGGQFLTLKNDPNAPIFFHAAKTIILDTEGNRIVSLEDAIERCQNLASSAKIEAVAENGLITGFLIFVEADENEFKNLIKQMKAFLKFSQIIELKIMHKDFDNPLDISLDHLGLVKQELDTDVVRAVFAKDNRPVSKWMRSQVRS